MRGATETSRFLSASVAGGFRDAADHADIGLRDGDRRCPSIERELLGRADRRCGGSVRLALHSGVRGIDWLAKRNNAA